MYIILIISIINALGLKISGTGYLDRRSNYYAWRERIEKKKKFDVYNINNNNNKRVSIINALVDQEISGTDYLDRRSVIMLGENLRIERIEKKKKFDVYNINNI